MFHPFNIISIRVVISGVSSTGFLSVLSGVYGHFSLDKEILKLKCLDKISVPYMTSIAKLEVSIFLRNIVDLLFSLNKKIFPSEDSSMSLHCLLEFSSNFAWGVFSIGISDLVEFSN